MKQTLKSMITSFLFLYIGLIVFARFYSEQVLFQPPQNTRPSPEAQKFIKTITGVDGKKIAILKLINPRARFTLLFSHGNAEDINLLFEYLKIYYDKGFSIIAYDYPGYGQSEGASTETGAESAIETVYKYALAEGIKPERLIAFGRSLGGGPTLYLARNHKLGGVMLESTFVSAYRVMTKYPLLPFDRFNNIARIKNILTPLFITHGELDRIIPFWHGKALFESARTERKLFFPVEGGGHNNGLHLSQASYWTRLNHFLNLIESAE